MEKQNRHKAILNRFGSVQAISQDGAWTFWSICLKYVFTSVNTGQMAISPQIFSCFALEQITTKIHLSVHITHTPQENKDFWSPSPMLKLVSASHHVDTGTWHLYYGCMENWAHSQSGEAQGDGWSTVSQLLMIQCGRLAGRMFSSHYAVEGMWWLSSGLTYLTGSWSLRWLAHASWGTLYNILITHFLPFALFLSDVFPYMATWRESLTMEEREEEEGLLRGHPWHPLGFCSDILVD